MPNTKLLCCKKGLAVEVTELKVKRVEGRGSKKTALRDNRYRISFYFCHFLIDFLFFFRFGVFFILRLDFILFI